MILLQDTMVTPLSDCQYIPGETWRFEFFFARDLDHGELENLLSTGWRKFGLNYFRPVCPSCRRCVPLRVRVQDFVPTKSQRRLLRKNEDVRVFFRPLQFKDRIYEIYSDHSTRFEKEISTPVDFIRNFCEKSCPSLQSEYYIGETLAAVGFLDHSSRGLSSVYFIFDTLYSRYSLGVYSALREIEHARSLGLDYYYLGFYIAECPRMTYKNRFRPYETMDWSSGVWSPSA